MKQKDEGKKKEEEEKKKEDEKEAKKVEEIKKKEGAEKAEEYIRERDKAKKKKEEEEAKQKAKELAELGQTAKEWTLLDYELEEGGGNLSSGEKALICICRAILRKTKIVILDEATATIDLKTEKMISEVINKKFEGCTMLVIAHRLQTIMDSDKVLMLGAGKKMEFGNPDELMKDDKSLFKKLVNRMQNLGSKDKKEKEVSKKE